LAGGGKPVAPAAPAPTDDEAVYLTEAAYRNRQPAAAAAPEIRERHFGLGVRRAGTARAAAATSGAEAYAGTRIVGAPHRPKAPPLAPPLAPDDDAVLRRLFGEPQEPNPPKAPLPAPAATPLPAAGAKRKKMDRGDVTVAALGVTLAAICAVFPWYIFFNQEKFGVREFVFSGERSGRGAAGLAYQPHPVGKPFAGAEVPKMELDFFPTATLPADQGPARAVPASEQPFPADLVAFRLVHVANGRAMIEDADGLWVVQRGSRLPDSSRVVSIEQRNGRWVLLTSQDKIVEIDAN